MALTICKFGNDPPFCPTRTQQAFAPVSCLFETMVVGELIKYRFNKIRKSNLYFFRDNSGYEVDVLIDTGSVCNPVEIKVSQTVSEGFFDQLKYYQNLQKAPSSKSFLFYGGSETYQRKDGYFFSFTHASGIMEEVE